MFAFSRRILASEAADMRGSRLMTVDFRTMFLFTISRFCLPTYFAFDGFSLLWFGFLVWSVLIGADRFPVMD